MAVLTVQSTPIDGTGDMTLVAAAGGGDSFPNDGKTFFLVNNGGGGQITVTFTTPRTIGGLTLEDPAPTVGAGAIAVLGPFPTQDFNDSNGRVAVSYSGVTTVTVNPFK